MPPLGNRFSTLNPVAAGLLLAALAHPGSAVAAGPTIGALIAVCDRAFAQGFGGVEAATCEWFAAPCACKLRDQAGAARSWCVPDGEPIETTVRKVVAALRLDPGPEAPSEPAVRAVLAGLYPCGGNGTPAP